MDGWRAGAPCIFTALRRSFATRVSRSPSFTSAECGDEKGSATPVSGSDSAPVSLDSRRGDRVVVDAAPPGAVSYETLAGIPWMSRGRLCTVLEEVAERGPYDVTTWNKLLCRAEAISASLSVRDIGRLVVGMAKVKYYHPSLLRKFSLLARRHIHEADAFACAGILHSYSTLNYFDAKLFEAVSKHLQKREVMDGCKLFPLSLALSACVREQFVDRRLFLAAGERLSELLPECKSNDQQSVALILNCLARLFNLQQQPKAPSPASRDAPAEPVETQPVPPAESRTDGQQLDLKELLGKIASSLPRLLPTMNLQSLTLVLNAFSRLRSLYAVPVRSFSRPADGPVCRPCQGQTMTQTAVYVPISHLPRSPRRQTHAKLPWPRPAYPRAGRQLEEPPKCASGVLDVLMFSLSHVCALHCPTLQPAVAVLTCETIVPRANKLTALQAVTVLNALVKLRLGGETDLLEAVLQQVRERAHHLTPQGVCLTVKALSVLRLKDQKLEEELERQVCLTYHHFSTAEVASLRAACQRWAHVPPSLERLLKEGRGAEADAEKPCPDLET
ncbi:hypothetical protein NCLIV_054300 [Neospora caninum Liverpool]|uniref:RAP domain-containing protein n=1 Tax=Neospora caninum (strain Liverpool) TaxID=572307 RepID=F0VMQ7_NEOCL|nr:hypothetical protein NCLIV_054300 [Neospora caninum Liverpool]CBZ55003.1 hypothetical protein NCLIV_054300 [Neospora caninum Liverpool]|eukprot:XP_003885031.1 hypothetical protein NCLIV_054300 [Neospora caninum Liverpool]